MTAVKERQAPPEADWRAMIDTVITMPGGVGNTYCRFYDYSIQNQVLLWMQGVREPVATFKRWQDMGRSVQKGSRAKWILRPVMVPDKDDNGQPTGEQKLVGFKGVRCLFTVSETDGDPLPEVAPRGWDLAAALAALNIKQVKYDLIDGNTQGYSVDRTYAINPVAVDPTHTTFHELAHIVLGHTDRKVFNEYREHRGLMEFQAEASAFIALNELGLATEEVASHARGYIQGWLRQGDTEVTDKVIRQVFTATDKILRAGREART